MTDAALALLLELREDVRAIRLAIEGAPKSPKPLRHDQAEALRAVVPVLGGQYGEDRFACWQFVDLAEQDTAEGANARIALAGRDAQALGKLLALAAGHTFDGIQIEGAGQDANGKLWRCVGNALPLED